MVIQWRKLAWGLLPLLLVLGTPLPPSTEAAETLYFLTLKRARMSAEGAGDNLLERLAEEHGEVQDDREVATSGVELGIYAAASSRYGIGVSLEVHDYAKEYDFSDNGGGLPPEQIRLETRALLYTLNGFLRFGRFLPYVGLGTGNYYVKYRERAAGVSFIDTAPQVWTVRAGFRMLFGRLGLLAEAGQIRAPLTIRSRSEQSTLELGGDYTALGISWSF